MAQLRHRPYEHGKTVSSDAPEQEEHARKRERERKFVRPQREDRRRKEYERKDEAERTAYDACNEAEQAGISADSPLPVTEAQKRLLLRGALAAPQRHIARETGREVRQ